MGFWSSAKTALSTSITAIIHFFTTGYRLRYAIIVGDTLGFGSRRLPLINVDDCVSLTSRSLNKRYNNVFDTRSDDNRPRVSLPFIPRGQNKLNEASQTGIIIVPGQPNKAPLRAHELQQAKIRAPRERTGRFLTSFDEWITNNRVPTKPPPKKAATTKRKKTSSTHRATIQSRKNDLDEE